MNKAALVICLLAVTIQTQAGTKKKACAIKKAYKDSLTIVPDALNFIVLGDWGRHGQEMQQPVADQMELIAQKVNVDFIVSTGDNFYLKGVASIEDPQWNLSFENVYRGTHLFTDWYPVLGNHDYAGTPEAEIAYTKKSRRWVMPDRYYQVNKSTKDKAKVSLTFIDSNPYQKKYYSSLWYRDAMSRTDSMKQNKWMDSVWTANATADWKFVFAHHPFYSSGAHKDEVRDSKTKLVPLFNKYGVDAYFAGHEHHLEHDILPTCHAQQFISGAGSELRPVGKGQYALYAESVNGFMLVSVTSKETLVQAIDMKGNVTYKYIIKK